VLELQTKLDTVDELFIHRKTIDHQSYVRQRDGLRQEMALVESQRATRKSKDFEGVLTFAEHVLTSADRLWTDASFDQKLRLQRVLSKGAAI